MDKWQEWDCSTNKHEWKWIICREWLTKRFKRMGQEQKLDSEMLYNQNLHLHHAHIHCCSSRHFTLPLTSPMPMLYYMHIHNLPMHPPLANKGLLSTKVHFEIHCMYNRRDGSRHWGGGGGGGGGGGDGGGGGCWWAV